MQTHHTKQWWLPALFFHILYLHIKDHILSWLELIILIKYDYCLTVTTKWSWDLYNISWGYPHDRTFPSSVQLSTSSWQSFRFRENGPTGTQTPVAGRCAPRFSHFLTRLSHGAATCRSPHRADPLRISYQLPTWSRAETVVETLLRWGG
jgi:hypothetical protein